MTQMFDEENVLPKIPYMTWEKVGDKVTGVYVGSIRNSNPDMYNKIKIEYVFKQADGTYIKVSGRALPKDGKDGIDHRIVYGMEHVQPGTVCGIKFLEERPNKGAQPTKILEVIYPNERKTDTEAVTEYVSKFGNLDIVANSSEEEINVDDVEL